MADRSTKNTISKKTNKQHTRSLRPCDRAEAARTNGKTDPPDAAASSTPPPPADEMHPGIRLLLEIGASRPELLLTGKPLTDQGRVATVMMDAGWSAAQLRHVITDRPLPHPVRTSVGAIIAARLRAAQAYPPPATAADHHDAPPWDQPLAPATTERSSTTSAARTVSEALTYRALVECAGCGVPGTAPGEDLCPACLGWPLCRTCPGPTPRRARPDGDGRCTTCASAFVDDRRKQPVTDTRSHPTADPAAHHQRPFARDPQPVGEGTLPRPAHRPRPRPPLLGSCASPCSCTNAPRGAGSPGPSPVTAPCPRFPTRSGCSPRPRPAPSAWRCAG